MTTLYLHLEYRDPCIKISQVLVLNFVLACIAKACAFLQANELVLIIFI